jgi:hypothetical protein
MSSKTAIKNNEDISQKVASKTVKVVFTALILDILAFTIILPLFPRLLQEYRVREQGDEVYFFLLDFIFIFLFYFTKHISYYIEYIIRFVFKANTII